MLSVPNILDAILMNRGRAHFESVKFTIVLNNYTDSWKNTLKFQYFFLIEKYYFSTKYSFWHQTIVLHIKEIDKNINFPCICSSLGVFIFIYNDAGSPVLLAALARRLLFFIPSALHLTQHPMKKVFCPQYQKPNFENKIKMSLMHTYVK